MLTGLKEKPGSCIKDLIRVSFWLKRALFLQETSFKKVLSNNCVLSVIDPDLRSTRLKAKHTKIYPLRLGGYKYDKSHRLSNDGGIR
jgi:hypothetical protein